MATLSIKNTDEVIQNLRKLNVEAKKSISEALYEAGNEVRDKAKGRVPVDTGALRDSIEARMSKDGSCVIIFADYPDETKLHPESIPKHSNKRFYYAFAVEYGSYKDEEQPFLHPALEEEKQEAKKKIQNKLGKVIDDANS